MPSALGPVDVSTGGVHPLVKKSMLPRIRAVKAITPMARTAALSGQVRGLNPGKLMSKRMLKSKHEEMGRKPRA